MDEKLKALVLLLCNEADEVLQNGDWPTDAGQWVEDATTCTCPLNDLIATIREGLGAA
jgi:hypothetical protein